jgi:chaperonin cofactor prefoldin
MIEILKKNLDDIFSIRQKHIEQYKETVEEFKKSKEELNIINKARNLEDILSDKTKNAEMNKIMKFYGSYFDEESGNTRKEGIDQLKEYLEVELKTHENNIRKLQQNIKELNKDIDNKKEAIEAAKKEVEKITENKNIFIPIIPMNITIIFRMLFAIFSFSIYFNFIDFNVINLIFNVPEIVLPTIISSTLLFL